MNDSELSTNEQAACYHIFFSNRFLDLDPNERAELVVFWEKCIVGIVSSNLAMIQGTVGGRESSCIKDNHSFIQDI
jgi:hypothetical protein